MALKIYNREHFRKVIRFANSIGKLADLRNSLLRMASWNTYRHERCACGGYGQYESHDPIPVRHVYPQRFWLQGEDPRIRVRNVCPYAQCDGTGTIKIFSKGLTVCHLYPDGHGVPDFYFLIKKDYREETKAQFNGGIIYHGEARYKFAELTGRDGVAPSFNVELSHHEGWSVHT